MQRLTRSENEAYAEIAKDLPRRRALAALMFVGHLIVVGIYLFGAVGKILEFGMDGHWEHFTNWAWTAYGIFYLLTLPAPFVQTGLLRHDSALGSWTKFIIVVAFVPLFGTASVVTVVVSVLLLTESEFLVALFEIIAPSLVMLGNDIFHFWPLLIHILFFIVYDKLIYFAHNRVLTNYGVLMSPLRTTIYILYQVFFAAGIFLLCYSSIHDPHEVYKTMIWTLAGVVVALLTLMSSLVIILIVLGLLKVGSPTPYSVRFLLTNYYDPGHEKKMQ